MQLPWPIIIVGSIKPNIKPYLTDISSCLGEIYGDIPNGLPELLHYSWFVQAQPRITNDVVNHSLNAICT